MNKNNTFTVAVAIYKVDYSMLRESLDSLVNQTDHDFEALLVDDGSPDKCGEICDEYASRNSNFRVIHQPNGGLSVVRNTGINEAKNKWIVYLDGDDWVEPTMIADIKNYANEVEGDPDVLMWEQYYNMGSIQKNNMFFPFEANTPRRFEGDEIEDIIKCILPLQYGKQKNFFSGIGTCNARAYRRDFLIRNNIYNVSGLHRMQDNEFNLWVFDKAKLVYYKTIRLYHYRYNVNAATKKYNPKIFDVMQFLYQCMSKFISERRNTPEYWQRLYLRFMLLFMNIVELDYANEDNPMPMRQRVEKAKRDFESEEFRTVIENCNVNGQPIKIKWCSYLLRRKYYRFLIYFSLFIKYTRTLRLRFR